MEVRFEKLAEKKLIGMHLSMSMMENKTGLLWSRFSPRVKEIQNKTSQDKISLQIYPTNYFQKFNPSKKFEKWACVEVNDFDTIPEGMSTLILEEGLYAVFDYKGSSTDSSIFEYIFGEWIPNSPYQVDERPHFEVLGANYKNNDPNSEEEIWIPIKDK